MFPVNLKAFKKKLLINRPAFRRFLNKMEKNPPLKIDKLTPILDAEVWQEIDCLSCANC